MTNSSILDLMMNLSSLPEFLTNREVLLGTGILILLSIPGGRANRRKQQYFDKLKWGNKRKTRRRKRRTG